MSIEVLKRISGFLMTKHMKTFLLMTEYNKEVSGMVYEAKNTHLLQTIVLCEPR